MRRPRPRDRERIGLVEPRRARLGRPRAGLRAAARLPRRGRAGHAGVLRRLLTADAAHRERWREGLGAADQRGSPPSMRRPSIGSSARATTAPPCCAAPMSATLAAHPRADVGRARRGHLPGRRRLQRGGAGRAATGRPPGAPGALGAGRFHSDGAACPPCWAADRAGRLHRRASRPGWTAPGKGDPGLEQSSPVLASRPRSSGSAARITATRWPPAASFFWALLARLPRESGGRRGERGEHEARPRRS